MCWHRKRLDVLHGIEICGRKEFLLQTEKSLDLLKPTSQFDIIQAHISIIQQGSRSGMKAWAQKPTFVVGKRTWRYSTIWYAGAIAHDAYHSKLYREAKNPLTGMAADTDAWTGAEAEKKCLAFQRQVLLELGADADTIAYLTECEKNPTYQGRHKGWRSWLDYLKRWW